MVRDLRAGKFIDWYGIAIATSGWLRNRFGFRLRERLCDPSRVQPTYTSTSWTGFPRMYMEVPITFLKGVDHQRLLDDARSHGGAGGRPH